MATVDILMATYNGEQYVREQVESVQAQTIDDWRLVVSDDCSTDATVDIIKKMAEADPRIVLVSEGKRYGSAKTNFMSLLTKSEAPYIMFCDQDDSWLPEKVDVTLARMSRLEVAEGTDKALMVFTDMSVVDAKLNIIHESFERFSNIDPHRTRFSQLLAQAVGAGCTMMVNRKAVELACLAVDSSPIVMHDWWLSLVCSAFGAISYLDISTSYYRQHDNNEVGAKAYRPIERASQFDRMCNSVEVSAKQAVYFRDVYRDILEAGQAKTLDEYVISCNTNGATALFHLAKSGCWKKGLRKLGQVAVAASNRGGSLR